MWKIKIYKGSRSLWIFDGLFVWSYKLHFSAILMDFLRLKSIFRKQHLGDFFKVGKAWKFFQFDVQWNCYFTSSQNRPSFTILILVFVREMRFVWNWDESFGFWCNLKFRDEFFVQGGKVIKFSSSTQGWHNLAVLIRQSDLSSWTFMCKVFSLKKGAQMFEKYFKMFLF